MHLNWPFPFGDKLEFQPGYGISVLQNGTGTAEFHVDRDYNIFLEFRGVSLHFAFETEWNLLTITKHEYICVSQEFSLREVARICLFYGKTPINVKSWQELWEWDICDEKRILVVIKNLESDVNIP